jgi:hypothetical protein
MSIRIASLAVIPAVLLAGGLALYGVEREPDATAAAHGISAPPAAEGEALPFGSDEPPLPPNHPPIGSANSPFEQGEALPPNHPPIGSANSPFEQGEALPPNHPPIGSANSQLGSLAGASDEPSAIAWKMPKGWQETPSPNAMRLATYRVAGSVEVIVLRAGGATQANIDRWVAQFDDVGHQGRVDKTVHGLHAVTVDVSGTYVGGGMTMGAPADPKRDWAMVGAIVESQSPSYFFKMTGPAAAVRAARPAFDRMIDSIAPL